MPQRKKFHKDVVIYLDEDIGDTIYIILKGKVQLSYTLEETGEKISRLLREGDIFGLKSAIINKPRQETAIALEETEVIEFKVDEFENWITKEPEVLLKTLKVLSNQLRNLGLKVNNYLSNNRIVPPHIGMFEIGEYFLNNRKYKQAIQVYERFLKVFPNTDLTAEVEKRISMAKKALLTGRMEKVKSLEEIEKESKPIEKADDVYIDNSISSLMSAFIIVDNFIKDKRLEEAIKLLGRLKEYAEEKDEELKEQWDFFYAKIKGELGEFLEAIELLKTFIQNYPNSKHTEEALLLMAKYQLNSGDKKNSLYLLKRLLQIAKNENIIQEAKELMKEAEE